MIPGSSTLKPNNMKRFTFLFLLTFMISCSFEAEKIGLSDSDIQAIIDLQDKRDTKALIPYFLSDNSQVRARACLAMASIQDTAALSSLYTMLEEDEEALTSMGGDSMEVVAAASAPDTLEVDMSEEVATTADHQEIDGDTSPEKVELQRLREEKENFGKILSGIIHLFFMFCTFMLLGIQLYLGDENANEHVVNVICFKVNLIVAVIEATYFLLRVQRARRQGLSFLQFLTKFCLPTFHPPFKERKPETLNSLSFPNLCVLMGAIAGLLYLLYLLFFPPVVLYEMVGCVCSVLCVAKCGCDLEEQRARLQGRFLPVLSWRDVVCSYLYGYNADNLHSMFLQCGESVCSRYSPYMRSPNLPRNKAISIMALKQGEGAPARRPLVLDFGLLDLSQPRPYLRGRIESLDATSILVDTGATISFVGEEELAEIARKSGKTFPIKRDSETCRGVTGESATLGHVFLNVVLISDSGKTLLLRNTPFLILPSEYHVGIALGTNVLSKLSAHLRISGMNSYLEMGNFPSFGRTSLLNIPSNAEMAAICMASSRVDVAPGEVKSLACSIPNTNNMATSWDKTPLLVTPVKQDLAEGIYTDEIVDSKRGNILFTIDNQSKEPVSFFPQEEVFKLKQMNSSNAFNVSSLQQEFEQYKVVEHTSMKMCLCELERYSSLCYVADPNGRTHLNVSMRSQYQKNEEGQSGVHTIGGTTIFQPHKVGGFKRFQNQGFIQSFLDRRRKNPKVLLKCGTISVLYTHGQMLDKFFMSFLQQLTKYINVSLQRVNPARLCDTCKEKVPFHLSRLQEENLIDKVNIVIPSQSCFPEEFKLFSSSSSLPSEKFVLFRDYPVTTYLRNNRERTFLVHMHPAQANEPDKVRNVIAELCGTLKALYPGSRVGIYSSALERTRSFGVFAQEISKGLETVKTVPTYLLPSEGEGRKEGKGNIQSNLRDSSISNCYCGICESFRPILQEKPIILSYPGEEFASTAERRTVIVKRDIPMGKPVRVYSGPWPTMTVKEMVEFPSPFSRLERFLGGDTLDLSLTPKSLEEAFQEEELPPEPKVFPEVDDKLLAQTARVAAMDTGGRDTSGKAGRRREDGIVKREEPVPCSVASSHEDADIQIPESSVDPEEYQCRVQASYEAEQAAIEGKDTRTPEEQIFQKHWVGSYLRLVEDPPIGEDPLQSTHEPVRLDELDEFYDFSSLAHKDLEKPLRTLIFLNRHVFKIKPSDTGVISKVCAHFTLKRQYIGTKCLARPINMKSKLAAVLSLIVERNLESGRWGFFRGTPGDSQARPEISSPIFLVKKGTISDREKAKVPEVFLQTKLGDDLEENLRLLEDKAKELEDGSKVLEEDNDRLEKPSDDLDDSPESLLKHYRCVIDLRNCNKRLRVVGTPLTSTLLQKHEVESRAAGAKLMSSLDFFSAFDHIRVSSASTTYFGLSIPHFPPVVSRVLPQGLHSAANIFSHAIQERLSATVRKNLLAFADDFTLLSYKGRNGRSIKMTAEEKRLVKHLFFIGELRKIEFLEKNESAGAALKYAKGEFLKRREMIIRELEKAQTTHKNLVGSPPQKVENSEEVEGQEKRSELDCGIPIDIKGQSMLRAQEKRVLLVEDCKKTATKYNLSSDIVTPLCPEVMTSEELGYLDCFNRIPPQYNLVDVALKLDPDNFLYLPALILAEATAPSVRAQVFPDNIEDLKHPEQKCSSAPADISREDIIEHVELLGRLFCEISKVGAKFKLAKCFFGSREVVFFGTKICSDRIALSDSRRRHLLSLFCSIKDVRSVQSLLGVIAFVSRFSSGVSTLSKALYVAIAQKQQADLLTPFEIKCARRLILNVLMSKDLFVLPDDKRLRITVDASAVAVAYTSFFIDDDGVAKPVEHGGRTLTQAENRYPSLELELIALMYAVSCNHDMLSRSPTTIIYTDCSVLCILFNARTLDPINSRFSRIIHHLSTLPVKFKLYWISSSNKMLVYSDALSRGLSEQAIKGRSSGRYVTTCSHALANLLASAKERATYIFPSDLKNKLFSLNDTELIKTLVENGYFKPIKKEQSLPRSEYIRKLLRRSESEETVDELKGENILPKQGSEKEAIHFQERENDIFLPPTVDDGAEESVALAISALQHTYSSALRQPTYIFALSGDRRDQGEQVSLSGETEAGSAASSGSSAPIVRPVKAVVSRQVIDNRLRAAKRASFFSLEEILDAQQDDESLAEIKAEILTGNAREKYKKRYAVRENGLLVLKANETHPVRVMLNLPLAVRCLAALHNYSHLNEDSMNRAFARFFHFTGYQVISKAIQRSCLSCRLSRPAYGPKDFIQGKIFHPKEIFAYVHLDHVMLRNSFRNCYN